ncbi:MAG: TIM barrel protein [Eubacteriales bacterium]|nr:TIM barrel protein [Eubacteriales bacterium]
MKNQFYISTIDQNAYELADKYNLGLELAEFCTAWNMDEKFEETDKIIWQGLKNHKRIVHGPFNELFPCAIDQMIRGVCKQRYIQAIETAKKYDCNRLVLHGGYNPRIYYPIWYAEQSPSFWRELLEYIPDDMIVCVENVFEEEPGLLAGILRNVNDPRIRMTLDIGHSSAYGDIPVSEWIRSCGDLIDHFHIHNNEGSEDTHSALTEGVIPMEKILRQIEEECPHATITLEICDSEDSIRWLIEKGFIE